MKEKNPQSLKKLVEATGATNWGELPEALGPLAQYADRDCLSAISTPGVSTDIAIVVLISLITRMEVMAEGACRVEHDQSKNLSTYHNLLQRYIEHDEDVEFRATEITSLRFPLKLNEVVQVDSKSSPAVQHRRCHDWRCNRSWQQPHGLAEWWVRSRGFVATLSRGSVHPYVAIYRF